MNPASAIVIILIVLIVCCCMSSCLGLILFFKEGFTTENNKTSSSSKINSVNQMIDIIPSTSSGPINSGLAKASASTSSGPTSSASTSSGPTSSASTSSGPTNSGSATSSGTMTPSAAESKKVLNSTWSCPGVGPVNINYTYGITPLQDMLPNIARTDTHSGKTNLAYYFFYKQYKPLRADEFFLNGANADQYVDYANPNMDLNNLMTNSVKIPIKEINGNVAKSEP